MCEGKYILKVFLLLGYNELEYRSVLVYGLEIVAFWTLTEDGIAMTLPLTSRKSQEQG